MKNGLRIRYALDRRTSGKTRRVPWVGAVSLRRERVSYILKRWGDGAPHSQPTLKGPKDTRLVRAPVQRAPGVQSPFEVERIVLPPVSREDVLEAASEGGVLPTFDRPA